MAIKVKAIERNVAFEKDKEKWAYVLQPELYSKLSQSKVIAEAALRSGISKGAINAAWDAIGEVIKAWATEGHAVAIPGLGSMRFGLRASSVADVNKVGSDLITTRRVIFVPNVDIKDELKRTSINITCYDRNGELVKRVTSSDEGNVEDPEGGESENQGGSQTVTVAAPSFSGNTQFEESTQVTMSGPAGASIFYTVDGSSAGGGSEGGSGGSTGGGSQTVTVAAPTFSGETQFTESTQVTMSGPAGASIFYTVDGSTPTDQSLEYEEPITLSETTTIKAIAIKDGVSSSVTSRTYTKSAGGGDDEPGGDDH